MNNLQTSPILALQHLRISVADLGMEVANYSALLGVAPVWRGSFAGEESAFFETDNIVVWLIAAEEVRGLEGLCLGVDSLPRMQRRLQRVGVDVESSRLPDLSTVTDAALDSQCGAAQSIAMSPAAARGLHLSFTEQAKTRPGSASAAVHALDHIVIASADAEATAFMLAARLGLDMRMDIHRPQWESRLLFFRCGDLIVEVFQHLGDTESASDPQNDRFYGLTWRIHDADATHQRLTEAGFDVSPVRSGRRPGTRVLTVRNRSAGVATLLIELPDKNVA